MDILEIDEKQIKVLLKKAYEWLAKVNNPKRNHRINYYKTLRIIKKLKKYRENSNNPYLPNKSDLDLILNWFKQYPARTSKEQLILTYIVLIYKLHYGRLSNIKE